MMTYLPSVIAAVVALLTVFVNPIQLWVAAHPAVSAVIAGLGAIVAHLSPQPGK